MNAIVNDISHASTSLNAVIAAQSQIENILSGGADNTTSSASGSQSSNSSSQNPPYGPSPSTAVAMIILYSITGLITSLFIIIIVVGAIRAHRHPERYGPGRNILGRPRQSRARGLARAMLDTIPIVKFNEREPDKEAAVELAGAGRSTNMDGQGDDSLRDQTSAQAREETGSVHSGIGPASTPLMGSAVNSPNPAEVGEAPGCSICTEDFEQGQDLRVLPCDHKFHPACIDPWLLNVSGTCPLCRVDLHPHDENEQGEEGDGSDLAPPLGMGGDDGTRRYSVRRSILLSMMGVRSLGETTQEERLAALRSWRQQQNNRTTRRQSQLGATTATDGAASGEEERSRRTRFRELFGIRTRRREGTDGVVGTTDANSPEQNTSVVDHSQHHESKTA